MEQYEIFNKCILKCRNVCEVSNVMAIIFAPRVLKRIKYQWKMVAYGGHNGFVSSDTNYDQVTLF